MAVKKRISVASAKAKGRRLQQWVGEKISVLLGIPAGKDEDIESRPMGQSGTDVILHGDARKRFLFDVECKAQEKWSVHAAIEQARANQKKGRDFLVIMKRSREPAVAIIEADVFFQLLAKLENGENS